MHVNKDYSKVIDELGDKGYLSVYRKISGIKNCKMEFIL